MLNRGKSLHEYRSAEWKGENIIVPIFKRQIIKGILLSIFINGMVPLPVYNILLSHCSSLTSIVL